MSRDRRILSRRPERFPARPAQRGSTLVGIFVGLILGALVAAGVALYFTSSSPFSKTKPEERVAPPAKPVGDPVALPGKPGDKPVEKPRFDFYNALPKGSEALPEPRPEEPAEPPRAAKADKPARSNEAGGPVESRTAEKPALDPAKILAGEMPATPPAAPAAPEKFFLQAGSFEDPSEADNLKARLALMGIEASVQKIELAEKGTVHRVRVGPYVGQDEMTKARLTLAGSGIPTVVQKIKPREPRPATPPAH